MGLSRPTVPATTFVGTISSTFQSFFILGPRRIVAKKRTDFLRSKLPLLAVNLCICLNIDHWTDTHIRCDLRSYVFLYQVKSNHSQNAENQKYSTQNSTVSFGLRHCYHLNL